jgi:hypothetical protein
MNIKFRILLCTPLYTTLTSMWGAKYPLINKSKQGPDVVVVVKVDVTAVDLKFLQT